VRECECCDGGKSEINCLQVPAQHPDSITELCMIAPGVGVYFGWYIPVLPRCNLAPTSSACDVGRQAPKPALFSGSFPHFEGKLLGRVY
jgi:hypothetical protein